MYGPRSISVSGTIGTSPAPLSTRALFVRDGICVDAPLCRGPLQGIYGLRVIGLVCENETVGKIGEVSEMGERENLCLWSVSSAETNET